MTSIRQVWYTPVRDYDLLDVNHVNFDGAKLEISLRAVKDSGHEQNFLFIWTSVVGLKITPEEVWLPWDLPQDAENANASTFIVKNSGWIEEILKEDQTLSVHYPNTHHYVILTASHNLEVLAPHEAEIVSCSK